MNKQAIRILESLSQGVDPVTGEIFSDQSCFSQVEVLRALAWATSELHARANMSPPKVQPLNAGTKWTSEEDALLRLRFGEGRPVAELSRLHSRSRGAINSRLERIGLIEKRALA